MLDTRKIDNHFEDMDLVKKLYHKAFPKRERIPMIVLLRKAKKEGVHFVAYYDREEFIGFAYMFSRNNITFIFYLAIDASRRSKGYGKTILSMIEADYPEHRLVLNIEELDSTADNYTQRVKRKDFYLKNGYKNAAYRMIQAGECYEVMVKGPELNKTEFLQLFQNLLGRLLFVMFKPKLQTFHLNK
ncbi:GNAT family N-acetyltransferase [Paenibacillus wulumuqiensis]|uniref:GNAT family N-acetyltransferase n=1 Tax=Paenibacillus wulumuqiensis TaxID=1567107 RepID=UPI0006983E47|nr:GNAT family N-acetyltransferase [Paenibacillus wulumuqiensis]